MTPFKSDRPNEPSRLTPEERYNRDPMFHYLVHVLLDELQAARYTPTELREACILAATIHEERRPVSFNPAEER